jgi:hypothetical protein
MPSHKEFYDALNNISVNADTLNLNTDQVESKLDTTTGLLTTLSADTAIIKNDLANGVLSDVRDGSGNAITSTVSGAKRSLDVTASVSFPSSLDTNTRDGSGNAITSTVFGSARRLDVNLSSAGTVGSTAPTSANLYGGSDGTNLRAVSVDSSGRVNANINGTVPVSGTVTANTGLSQPLTDTQLRATAVPVSGTVTANTGLSQPLTDTQLRATAVPVSGSVTALSSTGTITTRSSTITTGGTSQQVAASNTSRKYFVIQNISDTAMYLGVGYTPTTTTGLLLSANGGGMIFETSFIPTQAINVLCATTGKAFVAWEG